MALMENLGFCNGDCNRCKTIEDKRIAFVLNVLLERFGDEVEMILNSICPNLTCCPDCRIDDFCHMEGGCEISAKAEKFVEDWKKKNTKNEVATITKCSRKTPPFRVGI